MIGQSTGAGTHGNLIPVISFSIEVAERWQQPPDPAIFGGTASRAVARFVISKARTRLQICENKMLVNVLVAEIHRPLSYTRVEPRG